SARVPLMGVRKDYQRSALGMALVFALLEAVRHPLLAHGVERLEMSWTLEDNRGMRHIKERLGPHVSKTYGISGRSLVGGNGGRQPPCLRRAWRRLRSPRSSWRARAPAAIPWRARSAHPTRRRSRSPASR